jgi:hypothetical protein
MTDNPNAHASCELIPLTAFRLEEGDPVIASAVYHSPVLGAVTAM